MSKFKFITPDSKSFIQTLKPFLDIEFERDLNKIRKSNKLPLIWHPFGYIRDDRWYRRSFPKYKLYKWCKENKKPVYVVERGQLPNSMYIDRNGYLFNSSSFNTEYWDKPLNKIQLKNVNSYIEHFKSINSSLEKQRSDRISKEEFLEKIGHKNQKIVFVPFQTRCDTVTVMWCDWTKSLYGFQLIISELAKENPDILFITKDHPKESKQRMLMLDVPENVVSVNHLHYKDCLDYSDVVININSSVGLQAMMWDKPVIVVGDAFYQNSQLNRKAKNKKDIIKLIREPNLPDPEKVKRFIYYLKYQFYTDCIIKGANSKKVNRVVFEHPYENKKIIIK